MLLQLHFSHYFFQEQNTCRLRLQLYICISFKIEFMQTVSTKYQEVFWTPKPLKHY